MLLLELERSNLPSGDRLLLNIVNVVILLAFATDYIVELAVARNRRRYIRSEWASLLIVVAQALAVVPSLSGIGVLRALRGARLLRLTASLFRVVAFGRIATREGRTVLRRHAASFALGVAGLTWLSSAVAFTLAEDVGADGRISSFFDALWWSTTTITTVGYGDVFPVSSAGRLVGGFTMVVRISTFAVVTAKVAEFLVRPAADSSELGEDVGRVGRGGDAVETVGVQG